MEQVNIIGIDLAKRSFQLHGARSDGSVAFRRKVSREKLLYFLAALPRCVVAMEACASAHYWGREIIQLGHDVRLVPPIYVKPFVKRQKNDAADAEAICEAAQRPTMRFVAVKGEEQQARAMLFHTRDLLVRQRTQTINALRGRIWRSSASLLRRVWLMSVGWHRHSRIRVRDYRERSARWVAFCSVRSLTSTRRSADWKRSSAPARVRTSRRHG